MKTILTTLLLASAAFSQGINNYDTTVSLMASPDSFYIHPIHQYLYFEAKITASCPSYTSADFVDWVEPNHNANVERIPSQANPMIRVTAHCSGSEVTGIKAAKIFSFGDRYYKIKTGNEDVYFRVTEISNEYQARIEFSHFPYSTGIVHGKRNDNAGIRSAGLYDGSKGMNYLVNGKKFQKATFGGKPTR